jgi:hypothetical protein
MKEIPQFQRSDIRETQDITFALLCKYFNYPLYRAEKKTSRFMSFYFIVPQNEWDDLKRQFYQRYGDDRGVVMYFRPEFAKATNEVMQLKRDAQEYGEAINLEVEAQLK